MRINLAKLILEVVLAVARHVLTGLGGFQAFAGFQEDDSRSVAAGLAMAALGLAWSFKRKIDRAKQPAAIFPGPAAR